MGCFRKGEKEMKMEESNDEGVSEGGETDEESSNEGE